MTAPSQAVASLATITRYNIYMHSDDVQFMRECPDGDFVRYSDIESLVQGLKEMGEQNERMATALGHFASFPLEDFGYDDKRNDHPITGFNNWKLNVGHIRMAAAALTPKEPV